MCCIAKRAAWSCWVNLHERVRSGTSRTYIGVSCGAVSEAGAAKGGAVAAPGAATKARYREPLRVLPVHEE